jgi:hypothetical protein
MFYLTLVLDLSASLPVIYPTSFWLHFTSSSVCESFIPAFFLSVFHPLFHTYISTRTSFTTFQFLHFSIIDIASIGVSYNDKQFWE